jgi:tetratricopeptide (TPR) repeat protein
MRASNLSELFLTIGDVRGALDYAEQSVGLADKSGDWGMQLITRTKVGDALHQAGRLAESQTAFQQAEELQKKHQREFPLLYSARGYLYCDLLLSQGRAAEVERRARQTIEIAKRNNWLLDIALDNLSLGRAHLLHAQMTSEVSKTSEVSQALTYLNLAVDGLRQAGVQDYIVRGLLARAEYYRVTGDLEKAQKDLDEAFTIASRGGMGLFIADCHLEYARLRKAKNEKQKARDHLKIAKEMIEKMGYHRRDKEVEELEEQLK